MPTSAAILPTLLVATTTVTATALATGSEGAASATHFVLVLVLLTNLMLAGSSRLRACIQLVAAQGMLLGLLPILTVEFGLARSLALGGVSFVLKGIVFPRLLQRALRAADVRHEVDPLVGYVASVLGGMLIVVVSFWMAGRFALESPPLEGLTLPVALATILTGLFLLVARRTALVQVVGYLVLENGIFIFGVGLPHGVPLVVELGILLDVFVAVFVLGIAVFHISREFDHIDVDQLSQLKD